MNKQNSEYPDTGHPGSRLKKLGVFICALGLGGLALGVAAQQNHQDMTPEFHVDNTLLDVMEGIVMESANVLWQAGSVVSYLEDGEVKTIDYSPKTDEDWLQFENSAIALAEATNLMVIPGRPLADPELFNQEPPAGELSQQEIKILIDENWMAWTGFANLLHQTALDAQGMIQNRDLNGLMELGATLDEVCESCHQVFWYPEN